jgi:hypothetical protein
LLGSDHLWLGQAELVSVRQQLIPKIEAAMNDIERLLVVVISMIEVVNINLDDDMIEKTNNTVDDESIADMIREIWTKYETNGAPVMKGEESNSTQKTFLPPSILSLSKKEAQKQLNDEDFKLWKKSQINKDKKKGLKSSSNSDEYNSYNYSDDE